MGYEIYWVLVTIVPLLIASYYDFKNRLVPDKIWLIQIALGIGIYSFWILSNPKFLDILLSIINFFLSFIIALVVFYLGAFSAADSKALISVSISSPLYFTLVDPYFILDVEFPAIIPYMVNFYIFFILFAIFLFTNNMISIFKYGSLFSETSGTIFDKIGALISGRRIPREKIKNLKHEDPAEKYIDGKWKLYLPTFQEILDDEEYFKREEKAKREVIQAIENSDRTYLWTRPQPPGIIFLFLGYVSMIVLGSPIQLLLPIN